MFLSSDFNSRNIDARPALYLTDQWFVSSLHSSVLFLYLSDGQHPIAPTPATTNLRAPQLGIRCQKFKIKLVTQSFKTENHCTNYFNNYQLLEQPRLLKKYSRVDWLVVPHLQDGYS
jgi:hypothetical protein